jgi:multimeric flavodoxin WrbA
MGGVPMKTLITYYSYSGITEKTVQMLKEALEKKGDVMVQRLRPKKEITSFFGQCMAARYKKRCDIEDVLFDAGGYDAVVIASPVWAFAPVPAVNTFLDKASGLAGKKVVVLLTSGSGMGVKMCFKYIGNILREKGATNIAEIDIPNDKMDDKGFISAALEKAASG